MNLASSGRMYGSRTRRFVCRFGVTSNEATDEIGLYGGSSTGRPLAALPRSAPPQMLGLAKTVGFRSPIPVNAIMPHVRWKLVSSSSQVRWTG